MKKILLLIFTVIPFNTKASPLHFFENYPEPPVYNNENIFINALHEYAEKNYIEPSIESFENIEATNTRELTNLSLNNFNITMNTGNYLGLFNEEFAGAHAIEGEQYLGFSDGPNQVIFNFEKPFRALGLYFIDYGDFSDEDAIIKQIDLDLGWYHYPAAFDEADNGNEQFFGIITDTPIDSFSLNQFVSGEFYALDKILFVLDEDYKLQDAPNVETASVSESNTTVLLLTCILGLSLTRRRID